MRPVIPEKQRVQLVDPGQPNLSQDALSFSDEALFKEPQDAQRYEERTSSHSSLLLREHRAKPQQFINHLMSEAQLHRKLEIFKVDLQENFTQFPAMKQIQVPLSKAPYSPNICSPCAIHFCSLLCVSCTRWKPVWSQGPEQNVVTGLRIKAVDRDSVRQRPESSTQTDEGANRSEAETSPPTQSCCTSVPTTIVSMAECLVPISRSAASMFNILHLAALSVLAGTAATQTFTGSGELNITSCPITYFGQKYDKVYVSFKASKVNVCFNGQYQSGIKDDCILVPGGAAVSGSLSIAWRNFPLGSNVHQALPSIKQAAPCFIQISIGGSSTLAIQFIELFNFKTQAALVLWTYSAFSASHIEADVQVNGLTVSKPRFTKAEASGGGYSDLSSCRSSGVVYQTNTTVVDPSSCSTVSCDASAVAAVSVCDPNESCNGKGSCISNNVCTVIGSTVIGFAGQVQAVPDRCGYTLFRSTSVPGFQVVGVFQERRRKDVSFLKRVILQLDAGGVQISLEQGSRALLDTRELRLNTTAMVVHGWELTKDQTGVTAKMSASNFTVSVHFDGSITHIHLTGPNGHDAHGFCGNSSRTVKDEKVSSHSDTGCDKQYNEAADPTINCKASTDWCNLLKQAPFTACNMEHDPEPFITACTQALCKYPEGDGLKCQFLEAYAQGRR
ncbi:unnamed protein product [Pleuronectes platessa]|uniref:VWF/SSPO/Zonadhesin-like cysteine-rich domain-containing protein n=1 Tax=Pleuronectes platessa TaxID=8262 RepID=A0A9N7VUX2_PLEPL|nr:unnamed protein product [Pleuronectes platessa]